MAHIYSHLYNILTTGLRFFIVYGPWGIPDREYIYIYIILENETINVFNNGKMERDFTYIDDIVKGIERLTPLAPKPNPGWDETKDNLSESFAPYEIYNISNNDPVKLMKFIIILRG